MQADGKSSEQPAASREEEDDAKSSREPLQQASEEPRTAKEPREEDKPRESKNAEAETKSADSGKTPPSKEVEESRQTRQTTQFVAPEPENQRQAEAQAQYLDRLRHFLDSKGLPLEAGWQCVVHFRQDNTKHKGDPYFYPPNGSKRLRSQPEVLRYLVDTGAAPFVPSEETKALKKKSGETKVAKKKSGKQTVNDAPASTSSAKGISREEAIAQAKRANEVLQAKLPFKDGDLTVTRLGKFDPRPAYRSKLHIFPVGLTTGLSDPTAGVFISQIGGKGDDGPEFRVLLDLKDSGSSQGSSQGSLPGGSQELATAASPNEVWEQVARMQAKARAAKAVWPYDGAAVVGEDTLLSPPKSIDADIGETREAVNAALAGAQPLDTKSGLERFGLVSLPVLQALEGMEGVAECEEYTYVQQRHSWKVHLSRIRREAHAKTAAPSQTQEKAKKDTKPGRAKAGSETEAGTDVKSGSTAKRGSKTAKRTREDEQEPSSSKKMAKKDGTTTKETKDEAAAAIVMKKLLDNERLERKRKKQEAVRAAKDEAKRQKDAAAEKERQAAEEEAKRQADAKKVFEDSELPGAEQKPPAPRTIPGTEEIPAQAVPAIIELWELLGRFSSVMHLAEAPDIQDLAGSLTSAANDTRSTFHTAMAALADEVMQEVGQAALQVSAVANDDFKVKDHGAAIPNAVDETWPEIARRLFGAAAVGCLVNDPHEKRDLSGGLDVALGNYVGSSPLSHLGPAIVQQGLLAGSLPQDPLASGAALPVGACPSAAGVRTARLDARSLRALEFQLSMVGGNGTPILDSKTISACRCLLQHIAAIKGSKYFEGTRVSAKVLFANGDRAALSAKWARPLDLQTVAVRNDLGLYAVMPNGVDVFAADVRYVCDLFIAAGRNKKSDFAHTLQGLQVSDMAGRVKEALASKLQAAKGGKLESPSKKKGGRSRLASREGSAEPELTGATDAASTESSAPEEDLRVPLDLGDACCVCWQNEDQGRILICDGCDQEYHAYCVDPPLAELPEEDWFCPPCASERSGRNGLPLYQYQDGSDDPEKFVNDFAASAHSLGSMEFQALGAAERALVAAQLTSLFELSNTVREHLDGNETEKKELARELRELKAKIKKDDKGREEAEKERSKKVGRNLNEGPRPRTRAEEAVEAEALADRTRAEELIRQLQQQEGGVRREPLGFDRHWNRYWLLGSSSKCGLLCVESGKLLVEADASRSLKFLPAELAQDGGSAAPKAPVWGCYPDVTSLTALSDYLNPNGQREGPLLKGVRSHLQAVQRQAADSEAQKLAEQSKWRAAAKAETQQEDGGSLPDAGADKGNSSRLDMETGETAEERGEPASPVNTAKTELVALVDSLGSDSLDPVRASVERIAQWRALVDGAETAKDLMAALLLAESFLATDRLKPWWRLWSYPCPLYTLMGTAAAVEVRMRMLKAAVKRGPAAAARLGGAGEPGTRYTFREKRAAAGTLAEAAFQTGSSIDTSSGDGDGEALARKLQQSELANGGRVSRHRARPTLLDSNGARATRAAARLPSSLMPATAADNGKSESISQGSPAPGEDVDTEVSSEIVEGTSPAGEEGKVESDQPDTVALAGRRRLRKAA